MKNIQQPRHAGWVQFPIYPNIKICGPNQQVLDNFSLLPFSAFDKLTSERDRADKYYQSTTSVDTKLDQLVEKKLQGEVQSISFKKANRGSNECAEPSNSCSSTLFCSISIISLGPDGP